MVTTNFDFWFLERFHVIIYDFSPVAKQNNLELGLYAFF